MFFKSHGSAWLILQLSKSVRAGFASRDITLSQSAPIPLAKAEWQIMLNDQVDA